MPPFLKRLKVSAKWRIRRLRSFFYDVQEFAFWTSDAKDAPWYPDLDKLAEIGRTTALTARKAGPEDLELFRRYHDRLGKPLGPRRISKMRARWAEGSECYIALDREGEIASQLWVAYSDYYVEAIGAVVPVAPNEVLHFDVDTRPDMQGSMAFVACACAADVEGIKRGRNRIVAWGAPELFDKFRHFHLWVGFGLVKPARLERFTRVCGLRFRRITRLDENWSYRQGAAAKP